ncbi:hypothetical protein Zmor_024052 [Zophobas morio]|uniref:Uncharacterized protein n=1 Tax=Zophobas morio TaxID=2755281 RepID=A0AA38M809_9CUCU|nr:hypothetical protein Zmor_024052 [Zophobas morio]
MKESAPPHLRQGGVLGTSRSAHWGSGASRNHPQVSWTHDPRAPKLAPQGSVTEKTDSNASSAGVSATTSQSAHEKTARGCRNGGCTDDRTIRYRTSVKDLGSTRETA